MRPKRGRRWAWGALVGAAVVAGGVWGMVSLDWFARSDVPVPVDQPVPVPAVVTSPDLDPGGAGTLAGTSWVLESFAVDGAQVPAAAVSTLTFAEGGTGGGSTGCARYRLAWQQDGAALMLTADARKVGARPCDSSAAAEQEAMLLDVLSHVVSADLSDGTLVLLDADGSAVLRYRAAPTDFAGSVWSATGLVALTGDTPPGGIDTGGLISTITAAFAQDGTVSGFTGCRDYTGVWESDPVARTLAVTGVTTEGQGCVGQAAALETRYLRALGAVGGFLVEGSTLDLMRSPAIDAETLIRFTSTRSGG